MTVFFVPTGVCVSDRVYDDGSCLFSLMLIL